MTFPRRDGLVGGLSLAWPHREAWLPWKILLVSDQYERGPRIRSDFLAEVVASSGGLVSFENLVSDE